MPSPLVIFVAPAEPRADFAAMVDAARASLPPGMRVQISEREGTSDADVIVLVRWGDDAHSRASLTLRMRDGRTADRNVVFAAADPDLERGRALGFAAVAMIPEELSRIESSPEPAPPPPPPERAPAQAPQPGERSAPRSRFWLDVNAQGTLGAGGNATALGGGIAGHLALSSLSIRVGAATRFGEIPEAGATAVLFRADVGVHISRTAFDPRLAFGARTAIVLFHHSLQRTELDGGTTAGTNTLLGADLIGEASLRLAPRFSMIAGVGPEVAFGTTKIVLGASRVADIPPVRVLGELGARLEL